MAEKEYIERQAAKDAIFEYICGHTMSKFPSRELLDASKKGAEGAFNEIDYVPTADVEEVKHGEWFLLDECSNEGVYCSVCTKKVYRTEYANQKLKSPYCPNCGAKMDGGGGAE